MKPDSIELRTGEKFRILYEDRSVIAIDKPPDWMLVPFSWQKTNRNLQAALTSSIAAGDFWARSRGCDSCDLSIGWMPRRPGFSCSRKARAQSPLMAHCLRAA